jgi:hypothetical protein
MSPASPGQDAAALDAQFDAEVRAAGLTLSADDRQELFEMWADHLPGRDSLRAAAPALEEEPSLQEKPAQLGGGVTLPAASGSPSGPRGGGA